MNKLVTIGFVGLGAMGKPMAVNLLKAGYSVLAFDINQNIVDEIAKQGAVACKSGGEVAEVADIMITSLPNAGIVEAVMVGSEGIFNLCKEGAIIIDMSSVSPSSTLKMAALAKPLGIDYVDAPVSGGTKGAEAGTLTIMVGADDAVFEKIKPILEVIGSDIYHVGATGTGDAVKIVNNLMLGCNMATLAEALILGVKCGLKVETMQQIISKSSGRSYALESKGKNFILKGNFAPGFAVDLQYKDLELAVSAAKSMSVPLPMGTLAQQFFEIAKAKGWGREDISSIIKFFEEISQVEVRE